MDNRRERRGPMWMLEESGSGDESGWSGASDNSSIDAEGTILETSSVASDQDRFDAAYETFNRPSAASERARGSLVC